MGHLCPCTNCYYNSVLGNERRYWADLGLALTLPKSNSARVLAERKKLLQHHHDVQRGLMVAAAKGSNPPSKESGFMPARYIKDWYICATPVAAPPPALAFTESKGAANDIDNDDDDKVSTTTITPKMVKELKKVVHKWCVAANTPSWHYTSSLRSTSAAF